MNAFVMGFMLVWGAIALLILLFIGFHVAGNYAAERRHTKDDSPMKKRLLYHLYEMDRWCHDDMGVVEACARIKSIINDTGYSDISNWREDLRKKKGPQ